MKKILFIVFLFVFLTAVNVSAEIITEGTVAGGSYIKTADPDNASNEVYKLTANGNVELKLPITPINGGIIELSYRMRFENMGNNIIYLPMIVHDGNCVFSPMYHKGGLAIHDGTKMTFNRTYYENTWYNMKYVIDTEAMTFDVYVNDYMICHNYSFSTAIVDEISQIKTSISRGSLYLDDMEIKKIGESSYRTILFNSKYYANHTEKTIGNLPYRMTVDDFIDTLKIKDNVTVSVSTTGRFILDGDILNVHDDLYNNNYSYVLKVRTFNCSSAFFANFCKSIVLKENTPYCYINGEYTEICGMENGIVTKDVLNRYGISVQNGINLSQAQNYGLNCKQYNDCVILSKTPFTVKNIFTMNWDKDISSLF